MVGAALNDGPAIALLCWIVWPLMGMLAYNWGRRKG